MTGTLPGTPTFVKMAYAVPNSIVLTGGELYWSDWFGGMEYMPLAAPTTGKRQGSDCSGGPCEPRLRAGGSGASADVERKVRVTPSASWAAAVQA